MTAPIVVKFGGELLDEPSRLAVVVGAIARVVHATAEPHQPLVPLVIVHGGGKEIDAALKAAGIGRRQVDGVRITDEATLDVVVAVLAGAVNTRLVAGLTSAGVAAVGLTGADGRSGLAEPAPPHSTVDGRTVDLGRVGIPSDRADMRLVTTLVSGRFVPVMASIGIGADGRLLNVNADMFAGRLAARLGARRLVIAGTTPGVLDEAGRTIAALDGHAMERLIGSGAATAGMIAKLQASEDALSHGVGDVVIVDGRDGAALERAALGATPATATRIVTVEQVKP